MEPIAKRTRSRYEGERQTQENNTPSISTCHTTSDSVAGCSKTHKRKLGTTSAETHRMIWSIGITQGEFNAMRYDQRRGVLWARVKTPETGPLWQINPWEVDQLYGSPQGVFGVGKSSAEESQSIEHIGRGLDIDESRGCLLLTKHGRLQLVDVETMNEKVDVSLGEDVYLLSVVHDGSRDVYMAGDNRYRLYVISPDTHEIITSMLHRICLPYGLRTANGSTILGNYRKNCVHLVDEQLELPHIYKPGVENIGALNNPRGFCICPEGWIYICDTLNNRIVRCIPEKNGVETWEVVLQESQLQAKMPYLIELTDGGPMFIAFEKPPILCFQQYPKYRISNSK